MSDTNTEVRERLEEPLDDLLDVRRTQTNEMATKDWDRTMEGGATSSSSDEL